MRERKRLRARVNLCIGIIIKGRNRSKKGGKNSHAISVLQNNIQIEEHKSIFRIIITERIRRKRVDSE